MMSGMAAAASDHPGEEWQLVTPMEKFTQPHVRLSRLGAPEIVDIASQAGSVIREATYETSSAISYEDVASITKLALTNAT